MIVVFDLDGTLADIAHRLPYIYNKPKDWDKFHSCVLLDKPKNEMIYLNRLFKHDTVIICSGRNDICKKETIEWLDRHEVYYIELLMRKSEDRRNDVEVKRDMLNYIRNKYGNPSLAIEDRQRVVDFWRSEGITCLQCEKWEEK